MAYLIFLSLLRLHALFNAFKRTLLSLRANPFVPIFRKRQIDVSAMKLLFGNFDDKRLHGVLSLKVVCRELGLGFAQSGTQTNYFNSNTTTQEIISGIVLSTLIRRSKKCNYLDV